MTIGSVIHTILEIVFACMLGEAAYQAHKKYVADSHKQAPATDGKPIITIHKTTDATGNNATDECVEDVDYIEVE